MKTRGTEQGFGHLWKLLSFSLCFCRCNFLQISLLLQNISCLGGVPGSGPGDSPLLGCQGVLGGLWGADLTGQWAGARPCGVTPPFLSPIGAWAGRTPGTCCPHSCSQRGRGYGDFGVATSQLWEARGAEEEGGGHMWKCPQSSAGGAEGEGGLGAGASLPSVLCQRPEAPRGPSPQGAELQGPRPGSPHTSGSRRVCRPAPGAVSAPPAALCGSDESQDDAESSGSAVRKPLT